jgi:hypothetical protein
LPFPPSLHTSLSPVFLPRPFAILALLCTNVEDTHETLSVGYLEVTARYRLVF